MVFAPVDIALGQLVPFGTARLTGGAAAVKTILTQTVGLLTSEELGAVVVGADKVGVLRAGTPGTEAPGATEVLA